jgi:hypothetical protein
MEICEKCGDPKQLWHPGVQFKCAPLKICLVCDLEKVHARRNRVLGSTLDLLNSRLLPFLHQVDGIEALVKNPVFALFDDMGAGKTKQDIDAAQVLHTVGAIDRVVVVCPAPVRDVWYNEELGELKKHLWLSMPCQITEYHARRRQWQSGPESPAPLRWVITNFDFIREWDGDSSRLNFLKSHCNKKTWLIIDESSAIKNWKAAQTKACLALRKLCGRVTLLNGTPITNSPEDMFSQGNLMHPSILECRYISHYRARYAMQQIVMSSRIGKDGKPLPLTDPYGKYIQKITGWTNLEELQRRFAPYVLRRLKEQCLDLPAKMPPVALTVTLTEKTWRIYKQMRDEMVAWLSTSTVSVAAQTITKIMRLSQITSGFVGGLEEEPNDLFELEDGTLITKPIKVTEAVQEVGREKLDFFLGWLSERLQEDPKFKCIAFCRWRPELDRLMKALPASVMQGEIRGGQKKDERAVALQLLDPRTTPDSALVVGATPGAGSLGLNLTAASYMIRLSNDHSVGKRLQGDDRIHRPGQKRACSYFDIMAVGPKGQRTIDQIILAALREEIELANWTTQAWVSALQKE